MFCKTGIQYSTLDWLTICIMAKSVVSTTPLKRKTRTIGGVLHASTLLWTWTSWMSLQRVRSCMPVNLCWYSYCHLWRSSIVFSTQDVAASVCFISHILQVSVKPPKRSERRIYACHAHRGDNSGEHRWPDAEVDSGQTRLHGAHAHTAECRLGRETEEFCEGQGREYFQTGHCSRIFHRHVRRNNLQNIIIIITITIIITIIIIITIVIIITIIIKSWSQPASPAPQLISIITITTVIPSEN